MPFTEHGTPQHARLTHKKGSCTKFKGHRFKIPSCFTPLGNISAQNHRLSAYSYRILASWHKKTAFRGKLTQKKRQLHNAKGHTSKMPLCWTPAPFGEHIHTESQMGSL